MIGSVIADTVRHGDPGYTRLQKAAGKEKDPKTLKTQRQASTGNRMERGGMSALNTGWDRAVQPQPIIEDRFQEIARLQNRLDEAEAEMAALAALARKRGFDFLRMEGRSLLDEMGSLVTQLRHLILEDAPDTRPRRPTAPALPSRAATAVYTERLAAPLLLHN